MSENVSDKRYGENFMTVDLLCFVRDHGFVVLFNLNFDFVVAYVANNGRKLEVGPLIGQPYEFFVRPLGLRSKG